MKPKEYIAKYSISQGWRGGIQNRFLEDMRAELNQACEDLKVDNLGAFNNAMKVVSAKWTSISNKIPYGIPEQLWNYFYATIVCPKREELCGKDMEQVREDKAKKSEAFEINKLKNQAKSKFFKLHEKEYKESIWAKKPFEVFCREEIIKKVNPEVIAEADALFAESHDWESLDEQFEREVQIWNKDRLEDLYLLYIIRVSRL